MGDYSIVRAMQPVPPPPVQSVVLELSLEEFKTLACLQWHHLGMQHPTRGSLESMISAIRREIGYTVDDMRAERKERCG